MSKLENGGVRRWNDLSLGERSENQKRRFDVVGTLFVAQRGGGETGCCRNRRLENDFFFFPTGWRVCYGTPHQANLLSISQTILENHLTYKHYLKKNEKRYQEYQVVQE